MNALCQCSVPCTVVLSFLGVLSLGGCSDGAPSQTVQPVPLVTAPLAKAAPDLKSDGAITLNAGGVPTRYTPRFEGERLVRIMEERSAQGEIARGEYRFQGARLLQYAGDPLQNSGALKLVFNLQGALVASSKAGGVVSEAEVASIRSRAQLLRSHALAQRAARTHQSKR